MDTLRMYYGYFEMLKPPSTNKFDPVTYDADELVSHVTALATSSGRPKRRIGVAARSGALSRSCVNGVSI